MHYNLSTGGLDGIDVVRDQTFGIAGAVVDGVSVVRGPPITQIIAPLPKQVSCHSRRGQRERGLLPRLLDSAVVCTDTVLFQKTRLISCLASSRVSLYPARTKTGVDAPCAGVSLVSLLYRARGKNSQLSGYI